MDAIDSSGLFRVNACGANDRHVAKRPAPGSRCELHLLEPQWAAVVRFRAELDQLPGGFHQRYAALEADIIRIGQRPFGPPFAIFGKSDDNAVEVEVGRLIDEPRTLVADVEMKRLPQGLAVALTHIGPYEQVGAAYFELLGWIDAKSLSLDGPFMEVYLDGCDAAARPQISTRIIVPVCAPGRSVD